MIEIKKSNFVNKMLLKYMEYLDQFAYYLIKV